MPHRFLLLGAAVLLGCSPTSSTPAGNGSPDAGGVEDAGAPVQDQDIEDGGHDAGSDTGAPSPSLPAAYAPVPYLTGKPVREFAKSQSVLEPSKDYVAAIDTDVGAFVIDLFEGDTPITVNSFVFLALHHFYEGIAFHRVIDDFMAQTGDPSTLDPDTSLWGTGGCGYNFGLELVPALKFDSAGVLGMARADSPDSNGSQFFITVAARPDLDQNYTVWGKVLTGLEHLPQIARGEPPAQPTRILAVTIGTKAK